MPAYNDNMLLLVEMDNHVLLQILCDALDDRRVVYNVENVAVSRMFPGMTEARVLVEERDYDAARRILRDLELDR